VRGCYPLGTTRQKASVATIVGTTIASMMASASRQDGPFGSSHRPDGRQHCGHGQKPLGSAPARYGEDPL